MAADHKMRYGTAQEKSAYFAQLAHNYGIDLGTANEQQQAIDPRTYTLEQENLRLKNQLQDTFSREQDAQNATLNSEIAGFATDPKHRRTTNRNRLHQRNRLRGGASAASDVRPG